jgi:predicted nucleic acid-binding protein
VAPGVLIDTGPLVALIDRGEERHADCVAALREVRPPLLTTWPVVTEAMHLLRRAGWPAQRLLWELVASDDVELAELDAAELARARALMEKYRDLPMTLADATLVAVGERRRLRTVLTLDGDFHVYRTATRAGFDLLPAPAAPS